MQYGSGSPFVSYDGGKSVNYNSQTVSTEIKKLTITGIS